MKSAMSHHIKGQLITQTTLSPEAIDDFASEERFVSKNGRS